MQIIIIFTEAKDSRPYLISQLLFLVLELCFHQIHQSWGVWENSSLLLVLLFVNVLCISLREKQSLIVKRCFKIIWRCLWKELFVRFWRYLTWYWSLNPLQLRLGLQRFHLREENFDLVVLNWCLTSKLIS